MKIDIFQSDKGDCLLIQGKGGGNILVDGGMSKSYQKFVRPALAKMRENNEVLDLVYISHIDQDHISGVLRMLDDEVSWRVFEHHQNHRTGNRRFRRPNFRRPPEIKHIWHNAFHEQISENRSAITRMLAASAIELQQLGDEELADIGEHYTELVNSEAEAIKVSRRIGSRQLNIPLNEAFNSRLAMVETSPNNIKIENMDVYVIGPFKSDLSKLRNKWNDWLRDNRERLRKIRRKAAADERRLHNHELDISLLREILLGKRIGDRANVSEANLASLMLLIEENGKSVILTGDGHAADILKGLKHHGKLNHNEGIHVDVLKIQHHGSEHNSDDEFAKRVTADHYIFCGNGAHHNPDLRIVNSFYNSRLGATVKRSSNPESDRKFKFWFNSASDMPGGKLKNKEHMKKLEHRMGELKSRSNGKFDFEFFASAKKSIRL